MMGEILAHVRAAAPRVHCITNYVTANDCANLLLACGASPVMADDALEAVEITARCAGLTLNLGTLSSARAEAMLLAGQTAKRHGIPVVLDPVGVGASGFRAQTAQTLLEQVSISVIRGNVSEIKSLARGSGAAGCVDADVSDRVTDENLNDAVRFAQAFAEKTGAVVVMTGAIDIVASADAVYIIRNGHSMMASVTGAGCQLSALTAAFAAANPDATLKAAAAAVCAMGLAGEIAHARLSDLDGSAAYRGYLIDAIYHMTPEQLERGERYEMR